MGGGAGGEAQQRLSLSNYAAQQDAMVRNNTSCLNSYEPPSREWQIADRNAKRLAQWRERWAAHVAAELHADFINHNQHAEAREMPDDGPHGFFARLAAFLSKFDQTKAKT